MATVGNESNEMKPSKGDDIDVSTMPRNTKTHTHTHTHTRPDDSITV